MSIKSTIYLTTFSDLNELKHYGGKYKCSSNKSMKKYIARFLSSNKTNRENQRLLFSHLKKESISVTPETTHL